MTGPVTDSMKLARLPKWAQHKIETVTRERDELRAELDRMKTHQVQRLSWHKHTVKTSEIVGGKISTRFFVANDIDVELDNGLRLTVNPTHDGGEIRLYFGFHGDVDKDGRRAEAAIIPGATNSLAIKKVYLT